MILILSQEEELNVNNVSSILTGMNQRWFRLNGEDIPLNTGITLYPTAPEAKGFLENKKGERAYLDEIHSIWFRRSGDITVQGNLHPGQKRLIEKECGYTIGALYHILRDRFWINDFYKEIRAINKGLQLHIANKLGLRCPDSIVTSNYDEALAFYNKHNGNVLCKPISQSGHVDGDENRQMRVIYSNRLTPEMKDSLQAVKYAPTFFQEYVPKEIEFRVTIIGHHVFPTAIESQKSKKTSEDWRRYDTQNTPYYPYRFPKELEEKLIAFMTEMGLVYGAVDMILHAETGEFVFLEVNPGGQWGWVEHMSGYPITETLIETLIQGRIL